MNGARTRFELERLARNLDGPPVDMPGTWLARERARIERRRRRRDLALALLIGAAWMLILSAIGAWVRVNWPHGLH